MRTSQAARCVAWAVLLVPLALSLTMFFFAPAGVVQQSKQLLGASGWRALSFALGTGILLLPITDDDLTVSSQKEKRVWSALTFSGQALACIAATLASLVCISLSSAWIAAWVCLVFFCLFLQPIFWRITPLAGVAEVLLFLSLS